MTPESSWGWRTRGPPPCASPRGTDPPHSHRPRRGEGEVTTLPARRPPPWLLACGVPGGGRGAFQGVSLRGNGGLRGSVTHPPEGSLLGSPRLLGSRRGVGGEACLGSSPGWEPPWHWPGARLAPALGVPGRLRTMRPRGLGAESGAASGALGPGPAASLPLARGAAAGGAAGSGVSSLRKGSFETGAPTSHLLGLKAGMAGHPEPLVLTGGASLQRPPWSHSQTPAPTRAEATPQRRLRASGSSDEGLTNPSPSGSDGAGSVSGQGPGAPLPPAPVPPSHGHRHWRGLPGKATGSAGRSRSRFRSPRPDPSTGRAGSPLWTGRVRSPPLWVDAARLSVSDRALQGQRPHGRPTRCHPLPPAICRGRVGGLPPAEDAPTRAAARRPGARRAEQGARSLWVPRNVKDPQGL